MKKFLKSFKKLWMFPRFKSLIKLSGYLIFFVIFFIIASLGNNSNPIIDDEPTKISFNQIKTKLIEDNLKVNYYILAKDEYYMDGTIIDNVFTGTIDYNNNLNKIKINDESIYKVEKNEEVEDLELLSNIKREYLLPSNIVSLIKEKNPVIKSLEKEKTYSYLFDGISITAFSKEDNIYKIVILDTNITYELLYDNLSNKD